MTPTFGHHGDDKTTRAAKIRAIFTGASIQAHTEKCMRAGYWTDAENAAAAAAQHRQEVREALRALVDGLPWAGETAQRRDDKPVWKQLDMWSYEDFAYNITARRAQAGGDIDVLNRIIARCMEKFGHAPCGALSIVEGA